MIINIQEWFINFSRCYFEKLKPLYVDVRSKRYGLTQQYLFIGSQEY